MVDDRYESWDIRRAANETFSEAKGEDATQDEAAVGGRAAQGSLGGARESASQSPEDLLEQLRQAAKDEDYDAFWSAAGGSLGLVQAMATATQEEFPRSARSATSSG